MGSQDGSSNWNQRGRREALIESNKRLFLWFRKNERKLLAADVVCIMLLFFLHMITSILQILEGEGIITIQIAAIMLVSFLALSVIGKGIVPIITIIFGIVLVHNSVILPYYSEPQPGEASLGDMKFSWTLYTPTAVRTAASMNFFLGLSMVAFSIILAYKPSLLFTRNRPLPLDSEWFKYPFWQDNTILANGNTDPSVPVKSLVSDEERYLLWRYEYILASIYGTPHLVKPEGHVPKYSTSIYRDKTSGHIIGKARYHGYFV